MPRHPSVSSSVSAIGAAVYSSLAHKMAAHAGEVYPLHVGDTWLEPAEGCRMQDLTVEDHPGMHRYAPPQGRRDLIEAIAERTLKRSGLATSSRSVLVTAGATGALGAVFGAVLEPGDEVLVLAPYWPLITGIVRCFHARPVVVPFLEEVDSPESAVESVRRRLTPRCAALYISSPNNPSGRVFPASWLEALIEWARSEGLWIVSDEVYEDYVYEGRHTYCRPLAPERTFSAHSFSKAFGMAGNRCGYVIGPESVMAQVCKVSTHSFYSTPTASQLAAARALDGRGDAWAREAGRQYIEVGRRAARRLGLAPPEGSTFLFLDVSTRIDDRGLLGILEDCADRGLFLAPGESFGPYPNHLRLCFTSAEPAVVDRGVEVLARILDIPAP